jgi:hypothetical protein
VQGAAGLEDEGRGMSCGGPDLTIRRSLQSTGTEISQPNLHGVQSCDTSQTARNGRQLGGERKAKMKAKSKVKVKITGKVKVKAMVVWKVRIPPPHLLPSFPSWMRGFCGMRGKMLHGAKTFSFSLPLILCRRRFRRGWANICLFLAGSNSSNIHPSIHPYIHPLAVRTAFGLRLRVRDHEVNHTTAMR